VKLPSKRKLRAPTFLLLALVSRSLARLLLLKTVRTISCLSVSLPHQRENENSPRMLLAFPIFQTLFIFALGRNERVCLVGRRYRHNVCFHVVSDSFFASPLPPHLSSNSWLESPIICASMTHCHGSWYLTLMIFKRKKFGEALVLRIDGSLTFCGRLQTRHG
jgi:hypothetical protein